MSHLQIVMRHSDISRHLTTVHNEEDEVVMVHSSDEATTTGDSSDNDSTSESDGEFTGNISRKRQASPMASYVEAKLSPSDPRWQSHSVQQPHLQRRRRHLKQPLSRKADYRTPNTGLRQEHHPPSEGGQGTKIQSSTPPGESTMGPAQRRALDQGQRLQASSRAAAKSLLMACNPPVAPALGKKSTASASLEVMQSAGGMAWKKQITAHVEGTNIPVPGDRGRSKRRVGSADTAEGLMLPPLPKKPMASSETPFVGLCPTAPGSTNNISNNSGLSGKICLTRSQLVCSTSSSSLPRRLPRKDPAATEGEAVPDLFCDEVLDMDAVMHPGGEVRKPICRYLLPCWPEGVEGYEEIGGWRRLGSAARESSQRARRRV